MKECPRCHKKFNDNIKFCPVCGYKDDNINNSIKNVQFTASSGRHSVLERPFSETNGRPFFS